MKVEEPGSPLREELESNRFSEGNDSPGKCAGI